jgi:metallo-beta-lactamase class B
MKRIVLIVYLSFLTNLVFSQDKSNIINICDELQLIKISADAYIHISYIHNGKSKVPCNGLILIDNDKAFLFDTPNIDSTTRILIAYLKDNLKLKIVGFISNDWHWDSMGGLDVINKSGIPTYANEMTIDIAKTKGLPIPSVGFKDSLILKFGDKAIHCYYFGAAHTIDNIVVWIPSEQILFADCMIKELKAKDLGFTDDGDLTSYPKTLKKVKDKFSNAKIVIPGHGDFGGVDLIEHTIDLAKIK